jgi:hypothetical protein
MVREHCKSSLERTKGNVSIPTSNEDPRDPIIAHVRALFGGSQCVHLGGRVSLMTALRSLIIAHLLAF